MSVGDPRLGVKVSFEKLNATEKAGDRLELARLSVFKSRTRIHIFCKLGPNEAECIAK